MYVCILYDHVLPICIYDDMWNMYVHMYVCMYVYAYMHMSMYMIQCAWMGVCNMCIICMYIFNVCVGGDMYVHV